MFLLLVVVAVVVEPETKSELGTNGDGPTVLIGFDVAAVDAAAVLVLLFAGEVVRPSEEGRGICFDF
jgi:hypothetical protein